LLYDFSYNDITVGIKKERGMPRVPRGTKMITRDEMKSIKSSKKYLSWLFDDDYLLVYAPLFVNLPEGELKLTNILDIRKTKWSFGTWMNLALMGRPGNRESRKRAAERIIENPNFVTGDIDQLDVDRALLLLENNREKPKTREAMLILLSLKGEEGYLEKVIYEFRRKEIYGKEWNRLNDNTENIFSTYISNNKISIKDYFELPSDLENERICKLVAMDKDAKNRVIDCFKLNFESEDEVHYNSDFLLEWAFIYRTIGEELAFDMLWELLTQNLTQKKIDRWFKINQRQYSDRKGLLTWETDYVKLRLIELSSIGNVNDVKLYLLYGIIYGLGSFKSQDAIDAVVDSMLQQEPRKATFHYRILGDNIEYSHTSVSKIFEERKGKGGNLFKAPTVEHVAEIIGCSAAFHNNISSCNYSENIRELFRELAMYASENSFDSMLRASQYIFRLDDVNELIKIVATKRHPNEYSEEFNDNEKSKFIDKHLYQYSQLVRALEDMASKGSTQAKEIFNNDNLMEKIIKLIEENNVEELRLLLNNVTSKSRRENIDPHLLTMYEKSETNKNLILKTSQREAWKGGVEIQGLDDLIVRDLKNYQVNTEEHNENLLYSAWDYRNNHQMIDIIMKSLQNNINVDDGATRQLVKTLAYIGTDDTKILLDEMIPNVSYSLALSFIYSLNSEWRNYWSDNIEQVLIRALTNENELSIPSIIKIIISGNPSEQALQGVAEVMENHEHMAIKGFAIKCLGYHKFKPAIPVMISLLSYGRQKKEVLKSLDGGVISASYSRQEDLLQSLAGAFLRLRNDVIEPLTKELDSQDDNTRFGAALILNTIYSHYHEENLDLPKTKINEIIQEIPDSFNEEYEEPEPILMKVKPCCKRCKNPLIQDDDDYDQIEEELGDSGEMEVVKVEGKTIDEIIVSMELCCNSCMTEIHNEAYEKGLCYSCYDEGIETIGNIIGGEDKTLYCKDCEEYYT